MSRKWLEKEGPYWVSKKIITEEQYTNILQLYSERRSITTLLPVFASLLLGLSILTFVASNWYDIIPSIRFLILLIVTIGFYVAAERYYSNDSRHIGIALMALGVVSFGASIMLVGHMYHFVDYDARVFIFWSIPALILTNAYRSKYLFLLSYAIIMAGQIYSLSSFDEISWFLFAFFIIGLGGLWLREKEELMSWLLSIGLIFQFMAILVTFELAYMWITAILFALYVLTDLLKSELWMRPLRFVTLISGFLLSVFFIHFLDEYHEGYMSIEGELFFPNIYLYFPVMLALVVLSYIYKKRANNLYTAYEWILFLPLFYIWPAGDLFYLLALFAFSGYTLWYGYEQGNRTRINRGVALFLLSTFIAYIKIAWDFLPQYLFFLIGGIILFGLNALLQRKKKDVLSTKKEAGKDE